MNPIMSDLSIQVANHEMKQRMAMAQRVARASEMQTLSVTPRPWTRLAVALVRRIHELVDPRGFALREVLARDSASSRLEMDTELPLVTRVQPTPIPAGRIGNPQQGANGTREEKRAA